MISDAAAMMKLDSRGTPCSSPPRPVTMCRKARSLTSSVRGQVIKLGPISSCPWKIAASITAASRLWAASTAWMSPVKCRLISSIGTICARPPPVPPPLIPNNGPVDGCRRQSATLAPIRPKPWVRLMALVVLPSPARVGVIAVTTTRRPSGRFSSRLRTSRLIFALWGP